MKANNIIKQILPVSLLLMVLNQSCEELNDMSNGDVRDKLEGQWQCDETSEYFKSTAEVFSVYISPHPSDSTKILIDNFYELGYTVSAVATVSNRSLYINTQTIGDGFTIIGSGTISSNFNEIEWNYSVEDGSGAVDNVTATYTKL